MDLSQISPDQTILFEVGGVAISATIGFTWLVMAILIGVAWLATRRLAVGPAISRSQTMVEAVVSYTEEQVRRIAGDRSGPIVPFVGTLVLFIGLANVLAIVPGYVPPTGSLSTTTALAITVFVAVPAYGIVSVGLGRYLHRYIEPTPLMLPFTIISEISRTLALAVRLFGNVMSGVKVVAILLLIVPVVLPVVFGALGLLTGIIQAYIFGVLATVYIAAGMRAQEPSQDAPPGGGAGQVSSGPPMHGKET